MVSEPGSCSAGSYSQAIHLRLCSSRYIQVLRLASAINYEFALAPLAPRALSCKPTPTHRPPHPPYYRLMVDAQPTCKAKRVRLDLSGLTPEERALQQAAQAAQEEQQQYHVSPSCSCGPVCVTYTFQVQTQNHTRNRLMLSARAWFCRAGFYIRGEIKKLVSAVERGLRPWPRRGAFSSRIIY